MCCSCLSSERLRSLMSWRVTVTFHARFITKRRKWPAAKWGKGLDKLGWGRKEVMDLSETGSGSICTGWG